MRHMQNRSYKGGKSVVQVFTVVAHHVRNSFYARVDNIIFNILNPACKVTLKPGKSNTSNTTNIEFLECC